jgi:hypothetical protein
MSGCNHKNARLIASANGPRLVCPCCGDSRPASVPAQSDSTRTTKH